MGDLGRRPWRGRQMEGGDGPRKHGPEMCEKQLMAGKGMRWDGVGWHGWWASRWGIPPFSPSEILQVPMEVEEAKGGFPASPYRCLSPPALGPGRPWR